MKYYLVGIKGAGLSALSKLLIKDGHIVSGVDVLDEFYTCEGLENVKIDSFNNCILKKDYYYIIGNAYVSHDLVKMIKSKKYYYKYYPQFLYHYYKTKKWLCISGSHGKTTTTKMVSSILDNSVGLIGNGEFNYGNDDYFILESCEYKDTFLNYNPYIGLVLNVDYDHPDYFKSNEEYTASFIRFINNCKIAVVNGDDFHFKNGNVISYGVNDDNDVKFKYEYKDNKSIVYISNRMFYLPLVGIHYAYDFVGAYIICKLLNTKDSVIQKKILDFKMPKRRMDTYIKNDQVIICDYAHHPTEIKSFYTSIELMYPNRKKIIIFQPHTISRLEKYFDDFKTSLKLFDECYFDDIFCSIREKNNDSLVEDLYKKIGFERYSDSVEFLLKKGKNVVICFVGAGNIDEKFRKYVEVKI